MVERLAGVQEFEAPAGGSDRVPVHSGQPRLGEVMAARIEEHLHPAGRLHALQSLLYILVVALFVMTFTVQPFRIPSESMEPTLLVGDFLLVDKQVGKGDGAGFLAESEIARRDVIVFHYPVDVKLHLVKRVIGVPGDKLHLRDGRVYINGKPLEESYAVYRAAGPDKYRDNFPQMESASPSIAAAWWIQMHRLVQDGELTVPANSYFVMGDNRNDSEDSRYWGLVPRTAIVGKPLLVYFSVREKSEDEPATFAQRNRISRFVRWNRMLKVIR